MTIAYASIFFAYILVWVPRLVAARAQSMSAGGYDNNHPRDQQAALVGWGKRANAAHNNTLESFESRHLQRR